jgi:hypothetical protein
MVNKVKVSELSGTALDWAVAKCEKKAILIDQHGDVSCFDRNDWFYYKPSTNWAISGPIIEREKIGVACPSTGDFWDARYPVIPLVYIRGETPLIAAMRCYVASKLGDEIEIPKELYDKI